MSRFASTSLIALALCAPQMAFAQDVPPSGPQQVEPTPEPEFTDDEIVVIAQISRGLDVPEEPIITLDSDDIAAYGAGSLQELVAALGPQISSSRGRGGGGQPVFLVNGVRVSSFRELRSYPPEAVEKVEVLPEETAQRYGYSADRRVVNIVLKDGYNSTEVELDYKQPWDGGFWRTDPEITYLRIDGPSRLNLNADAGFRTRLTEADRDVLQAPGSVPTLSTDPDPAQYRTLIGDFEGYELTANWATQLGDSGTSLSLNGTFEREDSESLQGLDSVLLVDGSGNSAFRTFNANDPLRSRSVTDTYSFGAAINAPLGDWQSTATIDASRADTERRIDRRADTADLRAQALAGTFAINGAIPALPNAGIDTANSTADSVRGLVTLNGSPLYLPAGDVSVTFDTGIAWDRIESTDTRNPGLVTELERTDLSAGVNVGLPVASVADDYWAVLGDISLNLAAGVNELSDFGTLTDWSVGLIWKPHERVTLTATRFGADAAPGLGQLGNPVVVTPNVAVYDFTTGQTVLVESTTGGNALLPRQKQRDWKFGLNWEMDLGEDIDNARLGVEYVDNSSFDVASGFPLLTPDIEAAFPGRVTRNAGGSLTAVDFRPVSFARQDSQRLVTNLTLSGPFGKAYPEPEEPQARQGRPGGGQGGEGRGRGAGMRGGGPGGGGMMGDPEARQRFMEFREKLCADDGMEYLQQVIASAEGGDLPEGMEAPPEQVKAMLDRFRGPDGTIDMERLAAFRERVCSMNMGGGASSGGGGSRRGGRGGGMFGGGGDGRGRWFANISHNWALSNEVLIADGVPVLDLLNGDALGGATPAHVVNLRGGIFYRGYGLRLDANYTGSSRIDGSGLPGSRDLFFDDFATVDVRVFIDLDQRESLVKSVPFLEKTRVSVRMDNVFDARQTVTDGNGEVPITYQPFLVDPVGRYVGIEFRKLF